MAHDIEYFEHFFESGESYGDEERHEMMMLWLEFMKENQYIYGFSDEAIAALERKNLWSEYAGRLIKLVQRLEQVARREMEAAAARMDNRLAEAMKNNDGKAIPFFSGLPKKRGGN